MTIFENDEEIDFLKDLKDKPKLGLHTTLTGCDGLYTFNRLFLYNLFCKKKLNELKTSFESLIEKQINSFIKKVDRSPDYLDYHQHLQLMPFFYELLLKYDLPIRSTSANVFSTQDGLKEKIKKKYLAKNSFSEKKIHLMDNEMDKNELENYLIHTCQDLSSSTSLLFHPGFIDETLKKRDSLIWQRQRDYELLRDDAFFNVHLKRFLDE